MYVSHSMSPSPVCVSPPVCLSIATYAVKLKKKKLLHTTFKMFFTSILLHLIYLFFMCINYGAYANDGVERYSLKTFGGQGIIIY